MDSGIYSDFILAIALILLGGRIGGELTERYLKQPPVLGELVVGIIISPFALGGLIGNPIIFNFAIIKGAYGISDFSPLRIVSEIAIIVLLFTAGVGTNFKYFIRNIPKGSVVALGGAIVPFAFCFLVAMGVVSEGGIISWLFIGAAFTATSIGITVRVLMDLGRMHTKSATLILVAAVIDDIIGIIILSSVLSMSRTGYFNVINTVRIMLSGFGAWIFLMFVGARWGNYVSTIILKPFRKSGTTPIVALIIGLLFSYLSTLVDLHPAVGAYLAGLIFAATVEKEDIMEKVEPIMRFLSPFFFVFLGMQVDILLVFDGVVLIIILLIVATLGKFIGCYIPARFIGKLSHKGGMVVGIGMAPRGEICMIIIGAGLLTGAITREIFSVVLAVNIITILTTPIMLKYVIKKLPSPSTPTPVTH
ncbi:cation:proton antiporter [Chloroflexota bacterium]